MSPSGVHRPPDPSDLVIDVTGLRRRYSSGASSFEAVRGVDLSVRRGELFALLGTNGAGKTSTIELLEGLDRPSGGAVRVLGLDPYADRSRLRPRIGIMLQRGGFPGSLTVQEMARLWRDMLPRPRSVADVLKLVNLSHRARVSIESLSGGEQRRLDLALALLGRPEVLFLDEPTTGLDPQSRRTVWELVRALLADGVTVVLTTHLLEEAEDLADRIAIMHEGRVAAEGTVADLVAQQPSMINFALPPGTDASTLHSLVGAGCEITAEDDRQRVSITTFEAQAVLRQILDWAAMQTIDLTNLGVRPGSLERTFLDIAATPVRPSDQHDQPDSTATTRQEVTV